MLDFFLGWKTKLAAAVMAVVGVFLFLFKRRGEKIDRLEKKVATQDKREEIRDELESIDKYAEGEEIRAKKERDENKPSIDSMRDSI